ncbi:MAG: hypothetical protein IKT67_04820 [Lachnospiraceae bacterium]|nr:hypothetical protein [Lachnospiraceae bacterium]
MESSKKTILQGVLCVGLICVIWGGYLFCMNWLDKQIVMLQDDFTWVYQVDSMEITNGELTLSGFALPLDKDATKGGFEIVLQDIHSDKQYFMKMDYEEREDVNDYFLCEYNYLQTGFVAKIKEKKVDLSENDYEVLLRIVDEERAYKTGVYLSKGKMMFANPDVYVPLEGTTGTELEKVVNQGILRVYRPDFGIYVYQYEGELYWIADSNYRFDENGDTFIEFQLTTTQIDKLPEERLANEWYWDNIGSYFTENEIFIGDDSMYRVAKKAIPKEYSIVRIWMGKYADGWVWREDTKPYYLFK